MAERQKLRTAAAAAAAAEEEEEEEEEAEEEEGVGGSSAAARGGGRRECVPREAEGMARAERKAETADCGTGKGNGNLPRS